MRMLFGAAGLALLCAGCASVNQETTHSLRRIENKSAKGAAFDRRDEREGVVMAAAGQRVPQVATAAAPPTDGAGPLLTAPVETRVAPQESDRIIPADSGPMRRGDTFDYLVTDHATRRARNVVLRADRIDATKVYFNNGARVEKQSGEVVRIEAPVTGELDQATPPGGWMFDGRLPQGSWRLSFVSTVPGSRMRYDLVANADREQMLRVAAGEFRAIRIDLRGWVHNQTTSGPMSARYTGTAWFAPALRRVIRFQAKARSAGNAGNAYFQINETAELARIERD